MNINNNKNKIKLLMQESGVKHRVLALVKEKVAGGCPKEKVMFKKCKRDNKEDKKKKITKIKKDKNEDKQGNTMISYYVNATYLPALIISFALQES